MRRYSCGLRTPNRPKNTKITPNSPMQNPWTTIVWPAFGRSHSVYKRPLEFGSHQLKMFSLRLSVLCLAVFGVSATLTPKSLQKIIPSLSTSKAQSLLNDPAIKWVELESRRSTHTDLLRRNQKARANANVQPGFYFDYMLSLPYTLGNDETFFELSFETAANKMFVFDKDYDDEDRDPERPKWDPSGSKTAIPKKEPFRLMTAGCLATGKTYVEELRPDGDPFPFNQTIGAVTKFNFTFDEYPFDGVLGMAWDPSLPKQTPGDSAPPIVNQFAALGFESSYSFVIGESGSTIAYNYTFWGHKVPLIGWNGIPAIAIESFKYGNFESKMEYFGIIDTAYNTIGLPPALYRQVMKTTKPEFDPDIGLFTVDCGDNTVRPPRLLFGIDDAEYDVRQRHYIVDKDFPEEKCVVAISQSPTPQTIHLGIPFIRTVGISFDFEKNRAVLIPVALIGIGDEEED